jgi:hypothetical protein
MAWMQPLAEELNENELMRVDLAREWSAPSKQHYSSQFGGKLV